MPLLFFGNLIPEFSSLVRTCPAKDGGLVKCWGLIQVLDTKPNADIEWENNIVSKKIIILYCIIKIQK